jgi:hypothetical protein
MWSTDDRIYHALHRKVAMHGRLLFEEGASQMRVSTSTEIKARFVTQRNRICRRLRPSLAAYWLIVTGFPC